MILSCVREDCHETAVSRGYCTAHYTALRRAGAFAQPRIDAHPTPFAAALGPWVAQAACRDHEPDMWYPPSRHSSFANRAIRICLECPVIKECDKAIHSLPPHERWGIWAGKRYMGG